MPRLTGPLFSLDARQTLAKTIVYSAWKGLNYARLRVIPYNPKSAAQQGVRTTLTYGVDLVIEKDGIKTAVQAKCYKKQLVGENAIREVFSGKNYYKCIEAMVVTNSNYTRMAWRLAKSDNVKLWSRNYLIKVLLTEKSLGFKK